MCNLNLRFRAQLILRLESPTTDTSRDLIHCKDLFFFFNLPNMYYYSKVSLK